MAAEVASQPQDDGRPNIPTNDICQIIDSEGCFLPDARQWLADKDFTSYGFGYSVTTVLGCQSSGKSTLLNELFGTEFQVMNAKLGRQQTTKGAWLALSKLINWPMAIIDVEGTDSKERGEDRMTFEHRSALFSLALADVVVVNMWYHDLGRYTASNYGLLKTVLAVNLGLFQQQKDCPKTVLMFIIRDYSAAQTPMDTLQRIIYSDMAAIWSEIKKPNQLVASRADDFFDFHFVGIPSIFVDPVAFKLAVADLRVKWETQLCPKTYSRRIPADGFALYAENLWSTILCQSELDIPSQKEMLAAFRCEEIKNAVVASLAWDIGQMLREAQRGAEIKFDVWVKDILERAIEQYNEPASRYMESVFLAKRDQLVDSLCIEMQKIVDAYLSHMRKKIFDAALADLRIKFPPAGEDCQRGSVAQMESWINFSNTCVTWKFSALSRFDHIALAICAVDDSFPVPTRRATSMIVPDTDKSIDRNDHMLVDGSRPSDNSLRDDGPDATTTATTTTATPETVTNEETFSACDRVGEENVNKGADAYGAVGKEAMTSAAASGTTRDDLLQPQGRFETGQARQALSENLDAAIMQERERQMAEFAKELGSGCADHLKDLENLLSDPEVTSEAFWKFTTSALVNGKRQVKEKLGTCWEGLQVSATDTPEEEARKWEMVCSVEALRQCRSKLEVLVEWLHVHIINRFQTLFSSDAEGVPRQWQNVSADNIKSTYLEAYTASLSALHILESIQIDAKSVLPNDAKVDKKWMSPLLSEQKCRSITQRAIKAMRRTCQEAQILQATAGRQAYIPTWLYFLLLALGWNEIFAVIRSPILLALLLVVSIVGVITYLTGQTQIPLKFGHLAFSMFGNMLMPIFLMFQENAVSVGGIGSQESSLPNERASKPRQSVRQVPPATPPQESPQTKFTTGSEE